MIIMPNKHFHTENDQLGPFQFASVCELSDWGFLRMSTNFLQVHSSWLRSHIFIQFFLQKISKWQICQEKNGWFLLIRGRIYAWCFFQHSSYKMWCSILTIINVVSHKLTMKGVRRPTDSPWKVCDVPQTHPERCEVSHRLTMKCVRCPTHTIKGVWCPTDSPWKMCSVPQTNHKRCSVSQTHHERWRVSHRLTLKGAGCATDSSLKGTLTTKGTGCPTDSPWKVLGVPQTHHERRVVSQSQQPQPHTMHNVDHASNTCVLAKGYHASPFCIHHLLVVYQTNVLKNTQNNIPLKDKTIS